MDSPDPKPPDAPSGPTSPGIPPTTSIVPPLRVVAPMSAPRLWSIVLLAGLIAALIAWGIGETGLFRVVAEESDVMLMGRQLRGATAETVLAAEAKTAVKLFSVFGGLLGVAGGLSGWLAHRRTRRGLLAAVVGLIVGGAAGGLAASLVVPIHSRLVLGGGPEGVTSFVAHAGIWVPIGAATGLALGLGLARGIGGGLLGCAGGAVGAALAAILYDVLGALAFPLGGTSRPISTELGARLLALSLLALVSLAIALAAVPKPNPRRDPVVVSGPTGD